jgi:hypothetical protein
MGSGSTGVWNLARRSPKYQPGLLATGAAVVGPRLFRLWFAIRWPAWRTASKQGNRAAHDCVPDRDASERPAGPLDNSSIGRRPLRPPTGSCNYPVPALWHIGPALGWCAGGKGRPGSARWRLTQRFSHSGAGLARRPITCYKFGRKMIKSEEKSKKGRGSQANTRSAPVGFGTILITLPNSKGCIRSEDFMSQDLPQEDVVGHVLVLACRWLCRHCASGPVSRAGPGSPKWQ